MMKRIKKYIKRNVFGIVTSPTTTIISRYFFGLGPIKEIIHFKDNHLFNYDGPAVKTFHKNGHSNQMMWCHLDDNDDIVSTKYLTFYDSGARKMISDTDPDGFNFSTTYYKTGEIKCIDQTVKGVDAYDTTSQYYTKAGLRTMSFNYLDSKIVSKTHWHSGRRFFDMRDVG